MKIAEMLPTRPGRLWNLVRQCGIDQVVAGMDFSAGLEVSRDKLPWSYSSLSRLKARYEDAGFYVAVLESRPPMDQAKLGLPGRDEEIDNVCELLQNLGGLGIPVWCYEWMAQFNWMRTSTGVAARGGALVTGYDHSNRTNADLTEYGEVPEQQLWDSLQYFLEKVVPVAEASNVKLAMHPDDPPVSPIRGIGRIMRTTDNLQRLIDLVPSPANGLTFCQGTIALTGVDVPAAIRHFGGQDKIHFAHMRNVRGTAENFVETFHDDGQLEMVECMKAYRDIGFGGVYRPDHVPTMDGDSNDKPGYSTIGRLYAIGYLKGIQESVYAG